MVTMYNNPTALIGAPAAGRITALSTTGLNVAWLLLAAFALISAGVALLRLLPAPYLTAAGHRTSKHRRYSTDSAD